MLSRRKRVRCVFVLVCLRLCVCVCVSRRRRVRCLTAAALTFRAVDRCPAAVRLLARQRFQRKFRRTASAVRLEERRLSRRRFASCDEADRSMLTRYL